MIEPMPELGTYAFGPTELVPLTRTETRLLKLMPLTRTETRLLKPVNQLQPNQPEFMQISHEKYNIQIREVPQNFASYYSNL